MADEQRVKREVLEDRLLSALDEEGKVAILCTKSDLNLLMHAVLVASEETPSASVQRELSQWLDDLKQLRDSAFPLGRS